MRIRIRFAQLRGFASLNYCVSVKPPAAKPCAIFPTFAKENNPQKTRVLLFVSPLRVFSFALFGLLASGSALGGSPVPRWFCLWRGVVRVPSAFSFSAVFMFRFCAWFCFRVGSFVAGGRVAFVLSASGFWFRAWRFCLARVPVLPTPRRRWRLLRAVCPVCLGARRRGCRCCAPSPVCLWRGVPCRFCRSSGFVRRRVRF